VNGFLVRHDGSMISIDHIVSIEMMSVGPPTGSLYNVVIFLMNNRQLLWNKMPREEPEIRALLIELQQLVRKAIEY
jgi:hypothetical protein